MRRQIRDKSKPIICDQAKIIRDSFAQRNENQKQKGIFNYAEIEKQA